MKNKTMKIAGIGATILMLLTTIIPSTGFAEDDENIENAWITGILKWIINRGSRIPKPVGGEQCLCCEAYQDEIHYPDCLCEGSGSGECVPCTIIHGDLDCPDIYFPQIYLDELTDKYSECTQV